MTKKAGIAKKQVGAKVGSSETIMVLGIPFNIQLVENVDKEDSYGETEGPERKIKIKHSLNPSVREATTLHEICHAILYTAGVSEILESHDREGREGKLEEAVVIALENGLSQLYERKKDLTKD